MKLLQKILLLITAICLILCPASFTPKASDITAVENELVETELYTGETTVSKPWAVATSTNTTNSNGKFDSSLITKDGYFRVEYTGEEGNLSLAISNWTTSVWAVVNPSKSGKTDTGFYSDFTFEDCAAAYGSQDFSDINAICTSNGSASVTITKVCWVGHPVKDDLGADAILYKGSISANTQGAFMTNFFTKHVGGDWDASKINKDSYFYVEYTGAEEGIYLALTSASGATNWVAVYPDKTEKTASGLYHSIYSYDNFSKAFGTNFARFDQVQVYCAKNENVTLKRIAYFKGTGDPVDTSDGTWDRPDTGIAFLGDSIVQNALYSYGDWNGILGRTNCTNYGIGSQTTVHCEKRVDEIAKKNYSKVVMLCGINDLGSGIDNKTTIANYRSMFKQINDKNPHTQIYLLSILPTTSAFFKDAQYQIVDLNKALKALTEEYDYVTFVNCYPYFLANDGYCNADYSVDGLHPNAKGYSIIAEILNPYLDEETELYTESTTVNTPWTIATTTYTTNINYPNATGTFNPSKINKDGYFRVYYTGEEGNLYLSFNSWTKQKWAAVYPTKSGKTETGFYSDFSFADCAKEYGMEDFSDLSTISIGTTNTSTPMTISKLSWYSREN